MGQTTFSGPVVSQNGFIENSFTTAQRDAIVDPTAGLLIYNTTTNAYEVYNGTGWQAAFGGGGGGWPFYLSNIGYTNNFVPGGTAYYGPVVFNPTGTQYVTYGDPGAMGFKLGYVNVSTPFDVLSSANSSGFMSGAGDYSANGYMLAGGFYNTNGATFYTVFDSGMGNASVLQCDLAIPYDMASGSFVSTPVTFTYGGAYDVLRGITLSADGTKVAITYTDNNTGIEYVRSGTLITAFSFGMINWGTAVDITSYTNNLVQMQTNVYSTGISFDSTGTVAYIPLYVTGMMVGETQFVLELRVATAFDFSTINSSYTQIIGTLVNTRNYGSCSVVDDKFLVAGEYMGMQWGVQEFSLAALAAPSITSVSPSSGPINTIVTITGTGFLGTTSVTFGGVSATVLSFTSTQITVSSPNSTSNVAVGVTVTNPAGSNTKAAAFTNTSTAQVFTNGVDGSFNYVMGGYMTTQFRADNTVVPVSIPLNNLCNNNGVAGMLVEVAFPGGNVWTSIASSSATNPGVDVTINLNSPSPYQGTPDTLTIFS